MESGLGLCDLQKAGLRKTVISSYKIEVMKSVSFEPAKKNMKLFWANILRASNNTFVAQKAGLRGQLNRAHYLLYTKK